MDFYELLSRRRMHRSFLPDLLPRDAVERIARTVRRAPSGGYSQGQSVVVVTEPELRSTIAERFGSPAPSFVATAPVQLVPCVSERRYHERYNEQDKLALTGGVEVHWPVPYWFVDGGAAMMLILLAAIEEGFAAAFVGDPDQEAILSELLGLPDDVVPLGLALLGYPAADPDEERLTRRFSERRRPLGDVVHWERWSAAH